MLTRGLKGRPRWKISYIELEIEEDCMRKSPRTLILCGNFVFENSVRVVFAGISYKKLIWENSV